MNTARNRRVGLIGLGALGYRLATRLLNNGVSLSVVDTEPKKVAAVEALGGCASATPLYLAEKTNPILMALPSPDAVETVMTGPEGLLYGMQHDTIILDLSTLDPATSQHWAAETANRGGTYLDAPVTCSITQGGGTAAAACGELTFLVGGDKAAFESILDLLETLGRRFHHLGPIGSGSAMKLISNHLSGIQTLAIAEVLNLAETCGFSTEKTLEICNDTVANSYVLESIVRTRLDNPDPDTHFAIQHMRKDHRLTQTLASQYGISLPLNDSALSLCDAMCEAGYGQRDAVASIEYFRRRRSRK